jgi:hypothetical protein
MIHDGRQVVCQHPAKQLLSLFLQNKDIDPAPVAARVWGTSSFASYWVSDMLAVYTLILDLNQLLADRLLTPSLLCGRLSRQPCLSDSPLVKSFPVSLMVSHFV